MAKFQVITLSQEIIKPSSPTPAHLKSFKLSALDQLVNTVYSPVWFFYPNDHKDNHLLSFKIATLKNALSKTLTRFYPLAGRIIDSTSIHCNDEGAIFMHAKVLGCDMLGFLEESRNSKFELLDNLLPCQLPLTCSVEKAAQVLIKANVFPCGGIAIGMCLLYTIVDGTTFGAFIKTWADIARHSAPSKDDNRHHVYAHTSVIAAASSLFPPNESIKTLHLADLNSLPRLAEEKKNDVIKRFVFDANAISSLKSMARSKNVPNPSRVEVICGLVWKCLARSSNSASRRRPSLFINFVNLRTRLDPPLPEHSLGNMYWLAIAKDNDENKEDNRKDLAYYVYLLRKSFKEIDSNYIKKMQGEQGLEQIRKFHEDARESYSKAGLILEVSSLSRMGFYEADFGWGEPLWVASAPSVNNEMLLIGTKSGDGIEALVMLDEPRMKILQHDPDIQAYTSSSSLTTCNL